MRKKRTWGSRFLSPPFLSVSLALPYILTRRWLWSARSSICFYGNHTSAGLQVKVLLSGYVWLSFTSSLLQGCTVIKFSCFHEKRLAHMDMCVNVCNVCKPWSSPMLRVIISEASHQCSRFQEHHSAHWGGLKAHMVGFSLTHSIVLPSFPYTYSLLHYAFAAKSASHSTSPLNCSRLSGFK